MTDQNSQFFAILTAVGEAKQANANALGVPWTFSQMGVGDANLTDPLPSREQKKLINERRRAPLNQLSVDPGNPSIIIAEQVIPPDVGGWWIREVGLYDADGDLVAVANCAPSFKPLLSQGTGKTQVVRLNIIVSSTANVQLKIDPAVVLATRAYVDAKVLEVLPATRSAGTYTKVTVNQRGVVTAGENPTTLSGYGISDAYTKTVADSLLAKKASTAVALSAAVNLNTLGAAIHEGSYFQELHANATVAKGYPVPVAGHLVVSRSSWGAAQEYTTVTQRKFLRAVIGSFTGDGPWSGWVEMQTNSDVGFAYVYPNGGSAAAPAEISVNSRYVDVNPFGSNPVICVPQLMVAGVWETVALTSPGVQTSATCGVMAAGRGAELVTRSGNAALVAANVTYGLGTYPVQPASNITKTQCRVQVWRVNG